MITNEFAHEFVTAWLAAWNAHDIERIFALYADDFAMRSPLIVARMQVPAGVLRGKTSIRPYWLMGLNAEPPLRFELIDYFVGVDSIALYYQSVARKRVCEVFFFDEKGLVVRGVSHHLAGD